MAKTKIEKIAMLDEEIRQRENQRKKLIQEQKEQDRKDRTKRLCRRMGLFESLLPDTIPLSEELFKTFLEKTVTTEHSRRILDGLTAKNAVTAAKQTEEAAVPAATPPAAKPPKTERENAVDEGKDGGNGAGNRA